MGFISARMSKIPWEGGGEEDRKEGREMRRMERRRMGRRREGRLKKRERKSGERSE